MSAPVRVLLADDAAEMRSLLRWALAHFEEGVPVQVVAEVADGHAVLEQVRGLEPDVVVLDLQMPGLTAGELLRALGEVAPRIPIVTFSGYEPALVAPEQAHLVALHVPKTTDLALVRAAIVDVARGGGSTMTPHA